MKKLLLVAAAGLFFVVTSCTKDYTCSCQYDGEQYGSVDYNGVKKKDAEKSCDAYTTTAQAYNPGMVCTLSEK